MIVIVTQTSASLYAYVTIARIVIIRILNGVEFHGQAVTDFVVAEVASTSSQDGIVKVLDEECETGGATVYLKLKRRFEANGNKLLLLKPSGAYLLVAGWRQAQDVAAGNRRPLSGKREKRRKPMLKK